MKNIFTISLFFLSFSLFAQEAGRAGELLENEVRTNGNQTQKSNESSIKSKSFTGNSNYNFRWNYNYGNSEVFLRIPENGKFTVEIGDQMISNSSGKFRFFDLRAGNIPISIYQNNFLIYRARLNVKNNTRTVMDFFSDYGLYLLGVYPQHNQAYGISEWDDIWNSPYANQNGNWNRNNGNGDYYGNVMSNQEFNNLMAALKQNANFDDTKCSMISSVARNTAFTSRQIQDLVKSVNFDDSKLQIAKQLYTRCVDKQNFYLVYDAFNFDSSRRELSEYILRN